MNLTVLIPVHNTPAHHLLEAVRCITEQNDGGDHRIILIDDASTRDDTLWALSMLSENHDVHRLKWNSGISGALNFGHSLVDTEFVAHMDADDICHPSRFSVMLEYLMDHPDTDVLGCQLFSFWDDDGSHTPYFITNHPEHPVPNSSRRELMHWLVNHATVIIRQSAFLESGGYAQELWRAQDLDLWKRMHEAGATFANVPECLYGWRRYRASSQSRSFPFSAPSAPEPLSDNEREISETESQPEPSDPDTAHADA